MTILYFYQYFSTPNGSWGTRVYEFGKRWVKEGDRVIVVTSIYDKSDLESKGIATRFNFDGVEAVVLNIKISNKHSILYRIWTFVLYSIISSYYAVTTKCDLVIASSGPITVGIPGLAARYLRGRKLIFEVRDMWPEGAIQMGLLKSKWSQKVAYFIERTCYRAATKIVTLSPGMKKEIEDKYHLDKVESVPNASDNNLFTMDTSSFVLPDWASGKKIFLYTGNIGKVNNSWLIVKAAEILHAKASDALFLFIGDGQQKQEIQEYVTAHQLSNVRLLNLMPKSELVAWVQRAYFMMVPLEGKPILDTSSPNKLFDALAAGIPAIQTTQGWIKELLDKENCGITVPYNKPEELAQRCKELIANPALRDQMAVNAKRTALSQFDRDILSEKMHNILLEAKRMR